MVQGSPPLPSPIKRIFYMSSEGTNLHHEVFPAVNRTVLEQLLQVDAVVYGMGSLYTSICPSLVHISLSLITLCKSLILEKTWVA
jgi:2-phospho-L-lactate transferase/gluconeogenesis factor (CofD/UPF0052 family)